MKFFMVQFSKGEGGSRVGSCMEGGVCEEDDDDETWIPDFEWGGGERSRSFGLRCACLVIPEII